MARTQLNDSWITKISIDKAKSTLHEFLKQHKMKIVSEQAGDAIEITVNQGSQIATRFISGWIANPKSFPKSARICLCPTENGIKVEAAIEEALGIGWLDPHFKTRYEEYFQKWMDALKSAFPPC